MFNTVTKEAFYAHKSSEAQQLNAVTKERFDAIYALQNDASYLKTSAMPKLC